MDGTEPDQIAKALYLNCLINLTLDPRLAPGVGQVQTDLNSTAKALKAELT
jgi:hypothetical protein